LFRPRIEAVFQPLPQYPDHIHLEEDILAWWEAHRTFDELRSRNRGGPKWSFIDGPITANNPMGAHHCWGRTLKDVFQRYKAIRGFDQRYQNGFDCQGLWVEVGVERELGLNSKREIEEYGLAEFAERCKERVAEYAEVITDQSRRLGMWMDWDNDYYTFSDTNIEYIWRFLKECHERGWLYKGHRSVEWCPRCGTSLSQHELINSYEELTHPSLFVRLPLRGRAGESLVVWTTTPWTLPANVAAAVKPDAEYGLTEEGDWWAVQRRPESRFVLRVPGAELVGREYEGPFDELPAQQGVVHRVIPWDDVTLEEGTGIVHIATGCGAEDFELSKVHDLPVLMPINEAGVFYSDYGEFEGRSTEDVEKPIVVELERRGRLVESGSITHRYPICWRCATPLVFRIADDWLIRADEIRQPMLDANAGVEWTPDFYSKRMDDWLRNMDDWNISRRRYFGLPLPFYPCESCGKLNVVGSLEELRDRATGGLEQLKELHRPWIDEVPISCEDCGAELHRISEVGDAWLDAGIVPFSTLGWQNDEWREGGYATGASVGLSGADLPDHAYWEKWFPADWVSEMREQIRLWFYSQSFMSVTLTGRSPYRAVLTYENLRDEQGREMHRSWGNSIDAAEALQNMGADVMRWMFCEQVPSQNLKFGYGPAAEIRRRLLTLWNSVKFFVDYANVAQFEAGSATGEEQPLDRWLHHRTNQLVAEMTDAYERFWTPDLIRFFEAFVDDLSNWYIRRSRRRFWNGDPAALQALWQALITSVQVIAPVMPFFAEYLWRVLRTDDHATSVFLADWPDERDRDEELLAEVAEVRRVVELGRQARGDAGIKLRQPLRRLVVQGASVAQPHAGEIAEELRVKEVEFGTVEAREVRVKPNLPLLGPKLGKELGSVRAALEAGEFEQLEDGGVRVNGRNLSAEEVLVERSAREGWALAEDDGMTVAVTTELDDELRLEGRVLDLIHQLNTMRKDAGLALTDRIRVTLPQADADLLQHEDWIKEEVLATELGAMETLAEPQIARIE
jgi:isoleucyl-tRNA synthetase